MQLKYANLNVKKTCGDEFILTEVTPVYNFVDGKRVGDPIATNFTLILPQKRFDTLKVRIEGNTDVATPESPVQAKLEGLELAIKWSKDGHYIAGTATGISIVNS